MPHSRTTGPKFFVSRQTYWGVDPEEGTVVEVAYGGLDYANPDMLVAKWGNLGEGKEFSDPRDAVAAAIAVCEAWKEHGEKNAKVAMGSTGGNTIPFEPKTYDEVVKRAQELYDKLPKCAECGELLGSETYTHDLIMDDEKFCSEHCAEKNYNSCNVVEDDTEDDEEPYDYVRDDEADDHPEMQRSSSHAREG